MTKQLTTVILLLIIVWGCAAEDPNRLPSHVMEIDSLIVFSGFQPTLDTIELEQELIFTDSLLLDEITALEVDDSGTLFIAGESWNRRQVHIFNSDGSYSDSLGSYGEQSGQFLEINHLQLMDDDLLVFDSELNRITTYRLDSFELTDTLSLHPEMKQLPKGWPGYDATPVAALSSETFLVAFSRERNPAYEPTGVLHYYEVDKNGDISSELILNQNDIRYLIGDYAGRPAPFIIPLPEKPLLEISDNGRLYSAFSDEYLIHVQESDGTYSHAYYNRVDRHLLDPNEVFHPRFSHNDQLLRVWESAEYPEKWPVLYSLLSDDEDRIWISTITENRDELRWWIIDDRTGDIYATFLWPFNKPIYSVKNESVYTVEKNELGFKEVVKYRIIVCPQCNSIQLPRK